MFIDEVVIEVQSGKGGDGIVHFRREKYVNRGGPDGGTGGKGGDIIFRVNPHLNTLEKFRHQTIFIAKNGKRGGVKNQTGRSAENLILNVPPGTIVREVGTGGQIADLIEENKEVVVCPGGVVAAEIPDLRIHTTRRRVSQKKGNQGMRKHCTLS